MISLSPLDAVSARAGQAARENLAPPSRSHGAVRSERNDEFALGGALMGVPLLPRTALSLRAFLL